MIVIASRSGMRGGIWKSIMESCKFSICQKTPPPREIRFLEVNGMISETMTPEPIDFGVDIGGDDAHTLYVLDVTPAQWEAIQTGAMPLPAGWTLDGSQELGRR